MKLKVAASNTFPQPFLEALISQRTARHFISEVVIGALKVDPKQITPGGHFMQERDLVVPYDEHLGLNIAFTMVSKRWDRGTPTFFEAMDTLFQFYADMVDDLVPEGTLVHILCALALDGETEMPDGSMKRLLDDRWDRWIVAGKPGVVVENPPGYRYDPYEFR